MFTTVAFSQNVDTSGNLTYINAVADQHVRVEGYNIVVPADLPNLAAVYAQSANITQARIESPSLRRTVLYDVPLLNGSVEPYSGFVLNNMFNNPIPLEPYEVLRAQTAETATGAEQQTVIVWLSDGPATAVTGEIYTVRAVSATVLTPFVWTSCALDLSQTLPSGTYQLVGGRVTSNGAIAARFIFVGQAWRPGLMAFDSVSDLENPVFRYGGLGVWGEFTHDQPPVVEVLSMSADSLVTVFMDIIKTS